MNSTCYFHKLCKLFPIIVTSLMMYGCGGGGGGPRIDDATAQTLTGAQSPMETIESILAREPGIIARVDSMVFSTLYLESNLPGQTQVRLRPSCSGRRCSYSYGGNTIYLNIENMHTQGEVSKLILSKHGMTLFESTAQWGNESYRAYGSWLRHSTFSSGTITSRLEDVTVHGRVGGVLGDLTGARPNTTATWLGVMTGVPQHGQNRGILQGDARLTFSMATSTLNAEFTDIKDLDQNRLFSVDRLRFVDIPVSPTGEYSAGITGNLLKGAFYGPEHAETAGVVEQQGIVGSYGALKQ